jgi:hypothetical protein
MNNQIPDFGYEQFNLDFNSSSVGSILSDSNLSDLEKQFQLGNLINQGLKVRDAVVKSLEAHMAFAVSSPFWKRKKIVEAYRAVLHPRGNLVKERLDVLIAELEKFQREAFPDIKLSSSLKDKRFFLPNFGEGHYEHNLRIWAENTCSQFAEGSIESEFIKGQGFACEVLMGMSEPLNVDPMTHWKLPFESHSLYFMQGYCFVLKHHPVKDGEEPELFIAGDAMELVVFTKRMLELDNH